MESYVIHITQQDMAYGRTHPRDGDAYALAIAHAINRVEGLSADLNGPDIGSSYIDFKINGKAHQCRTPLNLYHWIDLWYRDVIMPDISFRLWATPTYFLYERASGDVDDLKKPRRNN